MDVLYDILGKLVMYLNVLCIDCCIGPVTGADDDDDDVSDVTEYESIKLK